MLGICERPAKALTSASRPAQGDPVIGPSCHEVARRAVRSTPVMPCSRATKVPLWRPQENERREASRPTPPAT